MASADRVWDQITNVDIHSVEHPKYFRILGIANPLRAEVIDSGVGGQRIAYFDTGKRFVQRITVWDPVREYAFSFNPEKGFKVAFFFDLSDGLVQIQTGSYVLTTHDETTQIELGTEYSIDARVAPILSIPVRIVLRGFQRFLLTAITRNLATQPASTPTSGTQRSSVR